MLTYSIKQKIPNMLTVIRVLVIPLCAVLIYINSKLSLMTALSVFTAAAITDTFDGYLARQWKVQSQFGAFFDPIADKLLIITGLVVLMATQSITGVHLIPALLIIVREIFMSGAREFLAYSKQRIHVSVISKWKTAVQCFAVGFCMMRYVKYADIIGSVLLWVSAILTIYTVFDYMRAVFRKDRTLH